MLIDLCQMRHGNTYHLKGNACEKEYIILCYRVMDLQWHELHSTSDRLFNVIITLTFGGYNNYRLREHRSGNNCVDVFLHSYIYFQQCMTLL